MGVGLLRLAGYTPCVRTHRSSVLVIRAGKPQRQSVFGSTVLILILENAVLMAKIRPILAVTLALFFYTVTDILVWQRIFEHYRLVEYADMYHTGWFVSLAGYATVGLILLWGRWKECLYYLVSLAIGAFSGLEDVLYYVLDGRPMPASLPWLSSNPMIGSVTREGVLTSVFFWIGLLLLLYVALFWIERKPSTPSKREAIEPPTEGPLKAEGL